MWNAGNRLARTPIRLQDTYVGRLWVWSFKNMPQKHLIAVLHECKCGRIALIRPKIMPLDPTSTHQLIEICARIEFFVFGGEIVENFGRSMNACRSLAYR